jgi:Arc/MetJ family transcription regulator
MDLADFLDRYRQVVSGLQGRLDDEVRDDVLTYLDTGEEGLAVEFLVDGLVRDRVPVTRVEADALLELMRYFDLSPSDPEADGFYAALADPAGAAAQLTVVDELPS